MPQILILTDSPQSAGEVVYKERVARSSLESEYFSAQLLERVGWAVGDADELENGASTDSQPAESGSRPSPAPAARPAPPRSRPASSRGRAPSRGRH